MKRTILDVQRGLGNPLDEVEVYSEQRIISILKKETGFIGEQIVATEPLRWLYVGDFKNRPVLLADATKFYLNCAGIESKNVNTIIKKICRVCYSSYLFGLEAQPITKEIWKRLPVFLKMGEYWIESEDEVYASGGHLHKIERNQYLLSLPIKPMIIL